MDDEKIKILIVDDDRSNIDALSFILRPKYSVMVAKDGHRALEVARKTMPDIILLDIVMPGMSGFEVLSELKGCDATRAIPVIFVTGRDNTEDERKGLLLGAVDYITKPFHDSIVEARIRTHVQIVEYIRTIEQMCLVDALTNLPNRRSFDRRISIEWERAARYGEPMGLMMIDIDDFKAYNDKHGHPQGDSMLKAIAHVLETSLLRPADFAARWGGEEFAVLLPDTSVEDTAFVAERIRVSAAEMTVPLKDGTPTNATISIGVNSAVPTGDTFEKLILGADKALYAAKAAGKNKVVSTSDIHY